MKILIIRFSSIGDIVLTTPVIRALKMQLNAEIHYCTKLQYKPLLEHNPYITTIHTYDSGEGLLKLIKKLQKQNFDVVVDLHHKIRSFIITLFLCKKTFTINKLTWRRYWFIFTKQNILPNKHIVDLYHDTVTKLGVVNDRLGIDFHLVADAQVLPAHIYHQISRPYVAVVIGGSKPTKITPIEVMSKILEKIDMPICLVGGKEDRDRGELILKSFMGKNKIIYNSCGECSLVQSAVILKHAAYVVAHDTGMMHIAIGLKKKVYAIFGPTLPTLFGPYATDAIVIQNGLLTCRPCSKSGSKTCPKKHFKCMVDLPIERLDFNSSSVG